MDSTREACHVENTCSVRHASCPPPHLFPHLLLRRVHHHPPTSVDLRHPRPMHHVITASSIRGPPSSRAPATRGPPSSPPNIGLQHVTTSRFGKDHLALWTPNRRQISPLHNICQPCRVLSAIPTRSSESCVMARQHRGPRHPSPHPERYVGVPVGHHHHGDPGHLPPLLRVPTNPRCACHRVRERSATPAGQLLQAGLCPGECSCGR